MSSLMYISYPSEIEHVRRTRKDYLVVDDVKIFPGNIIFDDAFDGREYTATLKIQNCGKRRAFIRILSPSSFSLKINLIERGQFLSPGLTLKRKIKFTYYSCSYVYKVLLPIQINGNQVDYIIYTTLCDSLLVVEPCVLDFGCFTIGRNLEPKTLTLTNIGTKTLHYSIDDCISDPTIIANPKQGFILPSCSALVAVGLLTTVEGAFIKEVWMNANGPVRIIIKGTALSSKLLIENPNQTKDFVFIEFPRTYIHSRTEQFLLIKNKADSIAHFCIIGEIKCKSYPLSMCVEADENFKHFKVNCQEGVIHEQERRIFCFMFSPILSRTFALSDDYEIDCSCILQLICLDYRNVKTATSELPSSCTQLDVLAGTGSVGPYCSAYYSNNNVEATSQQEIPTLTVPINHTQKIWLFGMLEKPRVAVFPDCIQLDVLKMTDPENRVVTVRNLSENLPITFRYKKIAFVEVKPSRKELQPLESCEVNICIKCFKLGKIVNDITFELVHKYFKESEYFIIGVFSIPIVVNVIMDVAKPKVEFNLGLTPFLFNEVGRHVENITFNTKLELPKMAIVNQKLIVGGKDVLIHFPNDQPHNVNACFKCNECETIFAHLPSSCNYSSAKNKDLAIQKAEDKYLRNYLREEVKKRMQRLKLHSLNVDYDLTNRKLLLCEDLKTAKHTKRKTSFLANFLPLTPLEMYNVKINPRQIFIGKVAVVSPCESMISIENRNQFNIRVFLQSKYKNVDYIDGGSKIIGANKTEDFNFIFYTTQTEGIFSKNLEVVINNNHIVDIEISGITVPRSLETDINIIVFEANQCCMQYINIFNRFNTDISYTWDYPLSCFEVVPANGYIKPHRSTCCLVKYHSEKMQITKIEASLLADGKLSQVVTVSAEIIDNPVSIDEEQLNFKEVPINMPCRKSIVLRNNSRRNLKFEILNANPITGMTITPEEGIIKGKEVICLEITVEIPQCIEFNTSVKVQVQQYKSKIIKIIGKVMAPQITITPKIFRFKKIPNHSIDTLLFTVDNKSSIKAEVCFKLSNYKHFFITEINNLSLVESIILHSGASKQLCMWHRPIDLSIDKFLLPLIINDVVGPCADYLFLSKKHISQLDTSNKHPSTTTLPDISIPKVFVVSNVMKKAISFSQTSLLFQYYPNPEFPNVLENVLIINNDSDEEQPFFIRIDQVVPPFMIAEVEGENVELTEKVISAVLVLGGKVKILLHFRPKEPGVFKCELPVYVKSYKENTVYNYIECVANFPPPSLMADTSTIYLEPVPLKTCTQREFSLIAKYHLLICQLSSFCSDPDVTIKIYRNTIDPRYIENVLLVAVTFCSTKARAIEQIIEFYCSCGSKCFVMLKGCTDNCSFTTHAFINNFSQNTMRLNPFLFANPIESVNENFDVESMSIAEMSQIFEEVTNKNSSSFPYYPTEDDSNFEHMEATVQLVEEWLYNEVFSGSKYLSIPTGLAIEFSDDTHNKGLKLNDEELPITTIINFYTGSKYNYNFSIKSKAFPTEYIGRVRHLWHIYKEIKDMLQGAGAFLPNIEPEYLLTYNQYIDYCKCILPQQNPDRRIEGILDKESFLLLSKQNWVDLLLQMQKVFLLYTKTNTVQKEPTFDSVVDRNLMTTLNNILQSKDNIYDNNIYHPAENMVIYWLQYVYNENRSLVTTTNLPERIIKLLDVDLYDSVVLAVVTMAYCPYLKSLFDDFYWSVDNSNEALINGTKMMVAWKKIELGFNMDPRDIVKPNLLQMLLLVLYFYDFISSVSPITNIELSAQLSFQTNEAITITNQNDFIIKYKLIFFQNESDCFSANKKDLILKPKSTATVVVTYWPKLLQHVDVYILFNGTNFGYHCAQNQCFHLFGKTLVNQCYQKFILKGKVNKISELFINMISPYEVAADYDLWITFKEPMDVEAMHLNSYTDIQKELYLPKIVFLPKPLFKTNERGEGTLHYKLTGYLPAHLQIWGIFINKDVGVFIIQTDVSIKKHLQFVPLDVGVTQRFLTSACICKEKTRNPFCPKLITVALPQKNIEFWEWIKEMFLLQLETEHPEDILFWKNHFATNSGAAIIRRFTKDLIKPLISTPVSSLFELSGKYEIKFPDPIEGVIFPDILPFKLLSTKPLKFSIHVDRECIPEKMKFIMVYLKGSIENEYELNFVLCD